MNDDTQSFREEWARFHSDTPPLGWMLRAQENVPWVRFHSLPGSKRYAECDAERTTILMRANALGARLLGEGMPCWRVDARDDNQAAEGDLASEFTESDDPDEPTWRFLVRPVDWRTGAFDTDLMTIADDKSCTVWMRRTDGAVFAPYDGGFDLFPASFNEVEKLRAERSDWLSTELSGL